MKNILARKQTLDILKDIYWYSPDILKYYLNLVNQHKQTKRLIYKRIRNKTNRPK